jgi:hypothetical protein
VPAAIDDLDHASHQLTKVAWGDEPAVVVGDSIDAILRARCAQDAALLRAVRSFAARGEHRAEGHANVAAHLQHHGRLPKGEAQRLARLSRFLDHQPALDEALADGRIHAGHVAAFADLHRERWADAWTEFWPHLIEYAEASRFEDTVRAAQKFANGLSPKDADDRFHEQVDGRRFSKATTIDGFGHLAGWLDPITYAIFAAEHDRLIQLEFEADWAVATEILGRDPDALELEELTRTRAQRSADALRIMAERSKTLAGGAVAAAAEVVIHLTEEEFEAGAARALGDEEAEYPQDGICELADGTVVPPIAAFYLSLIGAVRRVVYGADDEIISYGRARRPYSPAQNGALRAKYRRCAHPFGCDRTGRALQGDHVHEWVDGGFTDCVNGQCLCGFHNRWKTRHKHDPPTTARRDEGARRARPPTLSGT